MIKSMDICERETALKVAEMMVAAAKTAPKGSGKDKVVGYVLTGEDKDALAEKMRQLAARFDQDFIDRDSHNVDNSHCVVILGCRQEPFGLSNCHMCGFENCAEMKKAGAHCAFNITDLGIAIGSAVSIAADHRIDNRVMYSVGKAALEMGFLPEDVTIAYGIPLYTGSKSIFFDRGPGMVINLD